MPRKTRAQLAQRVQEPEQKLAQPPDVHLITIAYDGRGMILANASTPINQAVNLRALKAALAGVAQEVDALLLRAVEQEAKKAVEQEKTAEGD